MLYKIIVTFRKREIAKKIYGLLGKSKVYNSQEIMMLDPIKEVCDECKHK